MKIADYSLCFLYSKILLHVSYCVLCIVIENDKHK